MHKNSKKDYFHRDNLNWFGDVVRIKDADFETILDYFNALDSNQLEIIYLPKVHTLTGMCFFYGEF